jgi:hypothetical protein
VDEDGRLAGTSWSRHAFILQQPYRVACETHGLREFVVGANNAGAAIRTHADEHRCKCPLIMGEHGCHQVRAEPAERRSR